MLPLFIWNLAMTAHPLYIATNSPVGHTEDKKEIPKDEDALKLLYLALRNITQRWTMPVKDWRAALNRFAIIFEDRMPAFQRRSFTQNH